MQEHTFPRFRNGFVSAWSRIASSRNNQVLLAILCASVIARVAVAILLGNQVVDLPGTTDQISYHNLALRVLSGHGFSFGQNWWPLTQANAPTAHWSYLYTLFLVAVYAIFGPHPLVARLIQAIVVGILHPYLAYRISVHVFPPRQPDRTSSPDNSRLNVVPLLAATLTAGYVYFIYYAATLMTEPFYITAVMAALYVSMRLTEQASEASQHAARLGLVLGIALAAAVLLRQLVLLLTPFLVLWLAIAAFRQKQWRRFFVSTVIALALVALSILPFTIYNYVRFDRFVLLNTNTGYAFFWANHPIYGTEFVGILPSSGPSYTDLIPPELRTLDEASLEQALLKRGIQFVLDDPKRYILLSLSRTKSYFKFWPDPESGTISNISRVSSFGLFLPFMLYGVLRSFRDRNLTSVWLLYWFMAGYVTIHLLSWALIRYRLPVDAVLLLFAAYGLVDLARLAQTVASRKLEANRAS
jgi:hypothetical protein